MTDNCGLPEGIVHAHASRCYEAGRRDERAVVAGVIDSWTSELASFPPDDEGAQWAKAALVVCIADLRAALAATQPSSNDEPPAEEVPC